MPQKRKANGADQNGSKKAAKIDRRKGPSRGTSNIDHVPTFAVGASGCAENNLSQRKVEKPRARKVESIHQSLPALLEESSSSNVRQLRSRKVLRGSPPRPEQTPRSKAADLSSRKVSSFSKAQPVESPSGKLTELGSRSVTRSSTTRTPVSEPNMEKNSLFAPPPASQKQDLQPNQTAQRTPRKPNLQAAMSELVSTAPFTRAVRREQSSTHLLLPSTTSKSLQQSSGFLGSSGATMTSSSHLQNSPRNTGLKSSTIPPWRLRSSRENSRSDFSNSVAPARSSFWFNQENREKVEPTFAQRQQYSAGSPLSVAPWRRTSSLEQLPNGFETHTRGQQQSSNFEKNTHRIASLDLSGMGLLNYEPCGFKPELKPSYNTPAFTSSLPPKPSALCGHALPPKPPPPMHGESKAQLFHHTQKDLNIELSTFASGFSAPDSVPLSAPITPEAAVNPAPRNPNAQCATTAQSASRIDEAATPSVTTRMTNPGAKSNRTRGIDTKEGEDSNDDLTSVNSLSSSKFPPKSSGQQAAARPSTRANPKSRILKSQAPALFAALGSGSHSKISDSDFELSKKPTSVSNSILGAATPSPSRKQRDDVADSASSSLSPVEPTTPGLSGALENASGAIKANDDDDDDDDSMDEHQPPPAPMITQLKTFGDDPSTFPDPTIYEIRKVHSGMGEDEIRQVCSVAEYPHDDLHSLIPGTPPDKDFSNAKPSNQVQANTFATYLEPFFRPLTEEDEAFLRERGDRSTPFIIPRRGKKHYTEVWAEEDGMLSFDVPRQDRDKLPANQARGNIEEMNDDVAETDQISAGPLLNRLLSLMRPEHRAPPTEPPVSTSNGLTSADDLNLEMMGADPSDILPILDQPAPPLAPATYMAESATDAWKRANPPKLEYPQVDERIKQELRHIGIMPMEEEPDYEGHYDDEIAARLRMLQADLREKSIINGARKARLMDLTLDAMAYQEFRTIQDDLDGQLNVAYMKSTRTMGKNKKNKRPGGAGGGSHGVAGVARPGVRDQTKSLMDRRAHWIDTIGPAFKDDPDIGRVPRATDPNSSIFSDDVMGPYIQREREMWDDEGEGE